MDAPDAPNALTKRPPSGQAADPLKNAQPDSFAALKSVFESGDSGDIGAACLGFAGGMLVDVFSHGTTVLTIGSAAVAGATGAVGVKRSMSAWFDWIQSRKPPEDSRANRHRLARRADALATILKTKSSQVSQDPDALGDVAALKIELNGSRVYFETSFLKPPDFESKLEEIFQRMQEIRVTPQELQPDAVEDVVT